MTARDRSGGPVELHDGQGDAVSFLYGTAAGRFLLRPLVRPWLSCAAGWILDRRISACLIRPFVRHGGIAMEDYEPRRYHSFNDFFTRRIIPERRPIDPDPRHLTSPCDGKLTAVPIDRSTQFEIKGVCYTMEQLVRNPELAGRYNGGWLLLFRLSVDDYHRYCYCADGLAGEQVRLPGFYHTVHPLAAANCPIYRENTREYTQLRTEQFGGVLIVEVGALLVGKIVNFPTLGPVCRGEEKGYFAYGGSTVILCFEAGRLLPDPDILKNSAEGVETIVKQGEKIGAVQNGSECRRNLV